MKKYSCLFLILIIVFITTNITVLAYDENTNKEYEEAESTDVVYEENIADFAGENSISTTGIGAGSGNYDQVYTVFLQTYAAYYFSQLKENFGYNHKGTCSYVAVAMLLSYYDTYWDDSIIEQNIDGVTNEVWDVVENEFDITKPLKDNEQSPGIRSEMDDVLYLKYMKGLSSTEKLSDSDYDNFVLSNSNTYFHLELVRLGTQVLGMEYGIYPRHIVDLLDHYLYTYKGYDSSQVTINYKNWADLQDNKRDYIIEKVKNGIPVIVSGGNISLDPWGHTYIIYDYDEANDELYCHMGWIEDPDPDVFHEYTHVKFSTIGGTLIGGAITLEFNTPHSHSNNYVDSEGNTYCSCYFPILRDIHRHEYEACAGAENMFHVYKCGCVAENDTPVLHRFETVIVDNDQHKDVCIDCGYEREVVMHDFQYTTNNDNTHTLSCLDCGFMISEEHDYVTHNHCYEKCADCGNVRQVVEHDYTDRYVSKDNLYHYAYCICGSKQTKDHTFYETDRSKNCYDCSYSIELNHVHSYVYTPISNGRSHTKTCRCGISKTEMCIGSIAIDGTSRCTKCGQTLPSFPELLSVDEEEDAILNNKEDYIYTE